MKNTAILPSLLLLFTSLVISCQPAAEIKETDVTRIITTLAADDMEGRRMFSPGIEKASKFIQGEFKAAGLEYVDGLTSYEQKFDMYTITPKSVSVTINGEPVAEDNVTASVNNEKLEIASLDEVEVITVKAGEDFRAAISKARGTDGKTLILADPSHQAMFERYRGFLSGGNHVMELNDKAYVLVLTNLAEVTSVSAIVENDIKTESLSNVVGKISGKRADEVVLFSAHYDHLGIRGTEGDTIYNGANDDASGTTAVISLAKYFKEMGTQPERTILFACFTAEEGGGYGSKYFSRQLNPDEIVAMFNIEMIGKPAVSGPNTAWVTGFDRSTFGELLQKAVKGTEYEFYADPYPDQNLFYRSDNATLARLGVPAHSISTTPIDVDKDYHQASDEVSTLDLAHMTNTIKAIAAAATGMISGEDTPTRVDKSKVN
jgi:hypothetical protein